MEFEPYPEKGKSVMRERRWSFKSIVLIVLAVLVLILFVQNSQVVSVKFFFWELTMSRIIMFPLLVLAGFILGYVLCLTGRKKH